MNTGHCSAGSSKYIWQEGDTLAAVAARYSVSEDDLRAINPSLSTEPAAGDTLCVPAARCPNGSLYVVHRGDTFTSIASAFGISVSQLSMSNPFVDPDTLMIGQVLCVPQPEPPESEAQPEEEAICIKGLKRYEVLSGESYADLLMKTCMPYFLFRFLNPDLAPGNLVEGQSYVAPAESLCGVSQPRERYQIQPGQDLMTAARTLGLSAGTLLSRNPTLAPADFTPGTVIGY